MNYQFQWSVIYDYRWLLIDGVIATVILAASTVVASIIVGTLVALGRLYMPVWTRWFFHFFTEFFRNIPPIVQLFFWYFAVGLDGFMAGLVGLTCFTASHVAELVRSGLNALPPQQSEAARASGLSQIKMIWFVLLPQAFLRIIPPMKSEVVNVIKNTSIATTIGYTELTFSTGQIEALTFRGFEAATASTMIYAAIGVAVLLVMHFLDHLTKRNLRIGM